MIVSALAGVATLVARLRRRYEPARYGAALAVAAIIAGWALARWPTFLPGLTVHQAAAGHDTLVGLLIAVACGAVIVFPSLAFLFGLTLTGQFRSDQMSGTMAPALGERRSGRRPTRFAVACLIGGVGSLTLADAGWAHVIGVVCLAGFIVFGFDAVVSGVLLAGADDESTGVTPSTRTDPGPRR